MVQTEVNTLLIGFTGIVLTAIIGVMVTMYFRAKDAAIQIRKDADQHAADITKQRDAERETAKAATTALELKLEILTANMMPATLAFQSLLIKGLTHLHAKRTDDLLLKISPDTISPEEEIELLAALKVVAENPSPFFPQLEADMAIMLPMIIRRARAEQALGIHEPLLTIRPGGVKVGEHEARVVLGIEKLTRKTDEHDTWEREQAVNPVVQKEFEERRKQT